MVFDEELNDYLFSRQQGFGKFASQIKNLNHRGEYFRIKKYLDEFLTDKNIDNRFLIMPGLRGVGKTTILFQLYNYLLDERKINPNNILYITMDQIVRTFDTDLLKVIDNFLEYNHQTTQLLLDKKLFILVDECHFDKNWSMGGKILYDNTKNIFLICTGSSAIDLEINADVARRSLKQNIFPNNFKDYLLLKYDIDIDYKFSKTLGDIIYLGDKEHVKKGIKLEHVLIYDNFINLNKDLKIEFSTFLKEYGFPIKLDSPTYIRYEDVYGIINRIIENDIPHIKSFNNSTDDVINRIITYIALVGEGSISNQKIANYLSISSKLVNEILNALEKSQLIFSIKPYGNIGKILKKPWKYYFLSPSLKAAINWHIGRYNLNNNKCLGSLAENLVASTLFKLKQTRFHFMGLFYPPEKKGTDFIIRTKLDEMVPIEVGIGKKTKSQLTKTMNEHDCERGILISNRFSRIRQENNIIHIPLVSFGFL